MERYKTKDKSQKNWVIVFDHMYDETDDEGDVKRAYKEGTTLRVIDLKKSNKVSKNVLVHRH